MFIPSPFKPVERLAEPSKYTKTFVEPGDACERNGRGLGLSTLSLMSAMFEPVIESRPELDAVVGVDRRDVGHKGLGAARGAARR